jgi:DNA-directed RNA polymerase specialized sigma24 family protein
MIECTKDLNMDWRLMFVLSSTGLTRINKGIGNWEIKREARGFILRVNLDFNGDDFDKEFMKLSREQRSIIESRYRDLKPVGKIASEHSITTKRVRNLIDKANGRLRLERLVRQEWFTEQLA